MSRLCWKPGARDGYELRKLIETRSDVEKAGERRRKFYKLTKGGKKALTHAARRLGVICGRHQSRNETENA